MEKLRGGRADLIQEVGTHSIGYACARLARKINGNTNDEGLIDRSYQINPDCRRVVFQTTHCGRDRIPTTFGKLGLGANLKREIDRS